MYVALLRTDTRKDERSRGLRVLMITRVVVVMILGGSV